MLTIQRTALQSVLKWTGARKLSPGRDDEMESVVEQSPYQCDRCGATNVVAAPLVYGQGTHTYSTRFSSGTTQSFSAQSASPPRPQGYFRPIVLWGPAAIFFSLWTFIGLGSILEFRRLTLFKVDLACVFLGLCLASFTGLLVSFRKVTRYNREVYPRLRWNWEHTYICRRCGNSQFIPS